jgi:hypothetical protein
MVHSLQMASGHGLCQSWPDSGAKSKEKDNMFISVIFTLRSQRAPPGIANYRVRGTRYRLTGTGTGSGATTYAHTYGNRLNEASTH